MSDHTDATPTASGGVPNTEPHQPQSRRERRAMEEASKRATAIIPIPFVEKTPTGSTATITAPDVAILTPLEPVSGPKRGSRNGRRNATIRKVRLRPDTQRHGSRDGFVPRAGRRLKRFARETWSTAIRGFVVLVIGAFMVTLTLPSTGFNLSLPGFAATDHGEDQEVTTASNVKVATSISLGSFGVDNFGATAYGSGTWTYTVSNKGAIRWPFPYVAPVSSGFGSRSAPCAVCSTYHQGMDFDPAEGSPIYAIADGVVAEVNNDQWGFGRWVVIHHEVKGEVFDSIYAHMERDSVDLKAGDVVKVADYVGRVGNTGTSTGAHLHLEIHVDGAPVNPYTWLKERTKK